MTDTLLDHLLDEAPGIDTSWSGELRIHDDIYHAARLLPSYTARDLQAAGLVICHGKATNAPPRLRELSICVLTEKGKLKRAERIAELIGKHESEPDELTIATALGEGSPLLNKLGQILDAIRKMHAELIAVRCSMIAAAECAGQGDLFQEMLDQLLKGEAELAEQESAARASEVTNS